MDNISIREINVCERADALALVWEVFNEYESPDYTDEGIQEFYKSIHDKDYLSRLYMYGAFSSNELAGVIATRNCGTHIALFFVKGKYHRQGIGRMLFDTVKNECISDKMTVNSSPFAVPVYHKFGFRDVDKEQAVNGLRFTPMEISL